MSLVPVRRIWKMQRFCIERKRLDNLLLISDTVSLFPERYYLDSSVDFNGMRNYLLFPWEMSPQAIHGLWVQREFRPLQSPSIPCRTFFFPFFWSLHRYKDSTELRSFVPVKFIQQIQVPEEGTISAPACYCLLLDLFLTDTAGITEWSFEIPSKA